MVHLKEFTLQERGADPAVCGGPVRSEFVKMSLADVQRLIHNNSSRLPCDGLTLNCYVFSKMQLEAYRCKLAFKFMDTIEALKTQVPNLTHTSGISTFTLETGGRSSKQAKPTDLPQVAKISNFPENKNTKAHGPCMHAY